MNSFAPVPANITQAARALADDHLRAGKTLTLTLASSSMWPSLAPGDRLRVRAARLDELRPGDILVRKLEATWIVHRLIRQERSAAETLLMTKGDNAATADAPWPATQLLGIVVAVERPSLPHRALIDLIRAAFPFDDRRVLSPVIKESDWPLLVETAIPHGLAPLAFAALKKCSLAEAAPAAAVARLRLAYLRTSLANQMAFQELGDLLDRFERNRIPLIILKGAALVPTLYGDHALRPMGDLDLLVPRAAAAQAQAALIEQGYTAATEMARGFAEAFAVERSFLRLGDRPAQIDLHWHLFATAYYAERIPIEWFWRRTTTIEVSGRRALTFSPTAQLLYLSAHYLQHHYRRLIWSYDIARLMTHDASQIDWDEAVEAAAAFGLSPVLGEALREVCEQWGVFMPATVEARLRAVESSWKDQLMFFMSSLDSSETGLPHGLSAHGLRKKAAYSLRVLFPSRDYMRARFHVRHGGWLPLCYAWRAGKAVLLAARAAWSLTRAALRARRLRQAM
ncbi:MAG TPA: nucleotidyltransferase family protein [Blastocatellia bacterium]|nr:nucleotidyltransferase family protein [Blastocatellia bacterium]